MIVLTCITYLVYCKSKNLMHVSTCVYDQRNTSIQSNRQFAKVGYELKYMYDMYFAFYIQYE